MMFERFTDDARAIVVRSQEHARRLGHGFIGTEHLLLAAAGATGPAGDILRGQGVTPAAVEQEIARIVRLGPQADPLAGLDREALAAIGIDLDTVQARIEAAFGPGALNRAAAPCRRRGRLDVRRGIPPRVRRHARRLFGPRVAGALAPAAAPVRGHIPFTPRTKRCLARSLREAKALHHNYLGTEHLILALLASEGLAPVIVKKLGSSPASLRSAILGRYRQAS
jgi:ATP-dependent Clp protease ATP-binding subunit ClpA